MKVNSRPKLEICAADPGSVTAAVDGGADRIELCCALGEGGLTPSEGMITFAVEAGIPVNLLIRPRSGDFLYSPAELDLMERDIRNGVRLGVAGIVTGCLTEDGEVDEAACRRLVEASDGRSLTFHRAFDMCKDPLAALETIICLGFDRILTSGCAASATEGKAMLKALHDRAAGRIKILAGGGIDASNACALIAEGCCDELHASAKTVKPSGMKFRRGDVKMGAPDADEFATTTTSCDKVRAIADALDAYAETI